MFVASILSLLISSLVASAGHLPYPRSTGASVKINDFDYGATTGPLNWHLLDATYSNCATGKYQSPILIHTHGPEKKSVNLIPAGSLSLDIPQANSQMENLGSGLEVVLTNGTFVGGGKSYNLTQFHFHTPSEHHIDDEHYPAEVHFVFKSAGTDEIRAHILQLKRLTKLI